MGQRINMIAALGERNRVIGRGNQLPFSKRLKPDMNRFVELTTGCPVIMGHNTQESIDERYWPLKDRQNIVVSRNIKLELPGAFVANSVHAAIDLARNMTDGDIFVIGGQQVYRFAMPRAKRLYLTLVDEDPVGDTYFPEYDEFTVEVERTIVPDFEPRLTYLTLERP